MQVNSVSSYLTIISDRYKRGTATEHTYRGDLQQLIESLVKDITATNEPKRQACGAPDYIITKKDIPLGFIEAKDIGENLDKVEKSEQLKRYRDSLDNLILTDYLEFRLFRNGEKVTTVCIATIEGGKLQTNKDGWTAFENLIKDFCTYQGQTITSAEKLAKMMAGKARMMELVLENALIQDQKDELNPDTSLQQQFNAFKDILIHDIKPNEFADIYAQTIAYGMFAARLHDTTLDRFTRKEAADLIPKSNPFLRKLFQYIAGYDLDDRLAWIVDALADVFRATDIKSILKNFGKSTQMNDPVIHFYETFLSEYNPALRKSRGVWYTPAPVVNFIVRAVDDILKTEFNLKDGLASTETTEIEVATQNTDKRTKDNLRKGKVTVHKVQILDPATGTGTFLSEVVKQIYKKYEGQQGIWNNYVEKHLIPRLNGFEILMASYAMCHLKLELLLSETGYTANDNKRLRVYLTNSLEEAVKTQQTLFAEWLSNEAIEANSVKRDSPVMVVLGNPPYSGISINKGEWISNLIEDYKYVDGVHFGERKHWLQDDYVKFIRYGEYFIDKNGEGVLAFINNHSFIDNPTFRGMRWHLLNSFDTIYILNLHGNSLKKEVCPDGSPDKNVFDIQAGVSINLFIKTGKKKKGELAKVKYIDLWGKRESKYQALLENNLKSLDFKEVNYEKPFYFFQPKNNTGKGKYEKGLRVDDLFPNNVTGIVTMGDSFIIAESKNKLKERLKYFKDNEISEDLLKKEFGLGKNYAEWVIKNKNSFKIDESKFTRIDYRPFDTRWTYFDNKLIWRWRVDTMQHFIKGENLGLMTCRQIAIDTWEHVGITKLISDDSRVSNRSRERGYIFPLYLYPENTKQISIGQETIRTPNLKAEIVKGIEKGLGLKFTNEKENQKGTFAPIDILDYIYAVLHSPAYRVKYKEFLKIDFPRVPYPTDEKIFGQLVKLGGELRQLHLLESDKVEKFITTYPVSGNNEVVKPEYENGKVKINEIQYFDNVSLTAWEFYIGGYQPAQKWLKDRKGRILEFEDILHYQKMIVALTETDRIMNGIDEIFVV